MRRPIFFACWKSNKTPKEVLEFFEQVYKRGLTLKNKTEVVLAPAACYYEIARLKMPKPLQLGAQDVSEIEFGGRMGELSVQLLKEYGVKYCIVGDGTWRQNFESDDVVNKKIKLLQKYGITPVLCVGETWSENQNNLTFDVVKRQLQSALVGVPNIDSLVVCYRPIWVVQRGILPRPDYIDMVTKHIRKCLVELKNNPLDASLPILYGGQITPANVKSYMALPELDGIFFVGSSLNIDSFYGVINYEQQ
ncbi:MAG: triosephosphate isomerase [Clostridia bacterium]|nr:triosephosphate isomerase [Clostridia bacterium]